MIDTRGMVTVAEAARRLNRSIEQVRRNLREGKLKGQRVGNQWFVDETCLTKTDAKEFRPLISREIVEGIRRLRKQAFARNGVVIDAVELVRQSREEH